MQAVKANNPAPLIEKEPLKNILKPFTQLKFVTTFMLNCVSYFYAVCELTVTLVRWKYIKQLNRSNSNNFIIKKIILLVQLGLS